MGFKKLLMSPKGKLTNRNLKENLKNAIRKTWIQNTPENRCHFTSSHISHCIGSELNNNQLKCATWNPTSTRHKVFFCTWKERKLSMIKMNGVMVAILGNGHDYPGSNPRQSFLYFPSPKHLWEMQWILIFTLTLLDYSTKDLKNVNISSGVSFSEKQNWYFGVHQEKIKVMVGWLVFYGLSISVGYSTSNSFLCK